MDDGGVALPPVLLPKELLSAAGADEWRAVLLRASGGMLWFNLGGEYLARFPAASPEKFKLWKFPPVTMLKQYGRSDYARGVRAAGDGAMLAAVDGVYLMDWEGNLKKLY